MDVIKIPERAEIDSHFTWDLSPLFKNDSDWEALYKDLERRADGYKTYRGKLHHSAKTLCEAIEFDLDIARTMERLYTYAHLRSDEDTSNQHYTGLRQKAVTLYTKLSELASFMVPEIQAISDEVVQSFMKDAVLEPYRFYLAKILRDKPHTRTQEIEELLAMSSEMAITSSVIFGQLDNADITFGMITDEKGVERELSHGNFITFLMNETREVRERAFFQYYNSYSSLKHTVSATLAHSIKKDFFYAKVRHFAHCRDASLFYDNIPDAVYDTLVTTVRKNIGPLFTYFHFRKDALGLDKLHFYDTYVPIVQQVDFNMPYEEAVATCIAALKPLGDEYTSVLKDGLLGGWVDRYENRGKRSGAYSSGCFDSPPYILLNYKDNTINSLYTLIHEAGHSMHSYYSKKHQPYVYHSYSIFTAEVASTCNEALLTNYLLELYRGEPKMTAYILNREIDDIRATLYRQTMFAEYEAITHECAERGEPITLDVLRSIYSDLLTAYFGDSMTIDEELTLECLRIPHFYSAFYVYKYATGISAALTLARKIAGEGARARDNYLKFLSLGGSKYPLEVLLEGGVDMRNPQPIERATEYFESLVKRLIEVYKEIK